MSWVKEGSVEFLECAGYRLERFVNAGQITSIKFYSLELKLGQRVYSNGRFGPPKGTLGIVVKIGIPYEDGRTNDVIVVHFEGESSSIHMKFRDLDFSQ